MKTPISTRVFRILLRLYPADFRQRFGPEMERSHMESLRAHSTRLGRCGVVYVWIRIAWDTVSHASSLRFSPGVRGPRRTSGTSWESVLQDIRLAARRVRKTPGFTIVVAVTAALGISLTALAFAIINACWFRPLPHVSDPQELAFIVREFPSRGSQWMRVSYQDYLEIRDRSTTMASVGAVIPDIDFTVRIGSGFEREIKGAEMSEDYFHVLGRRLALGGGLSPNETGTASDQVVIGYNLWQREYGGDHSVLGEKMQIDGTTYTIVGVAPQGSSSGMVTGTIEANVWIPVKQQRRSDGARPALVVVGRRQEGQVIERTRAELETLSGALAARNPEQWEDNSGQRARLLALTDFESRLGPLHENFLPSMIFWFVLVGVTMLVTCSNVATLLLNRALRRRTEIATRLALGSGRGRLVRQLLLESILLFGIAGCLGLLFIHWQTQLLARGRSLYPFPVDITVDPMVVFFAAALTIGSGVMFGLAPALQASHPDLLATLKGTGRLVRFRRFGARNLLVLTQVAGSTVLIAVTALMTRDIRRGSGLDVGFDTRNIGVLSLDLRLRDYGYEQGARFVEDLSERCAGIAGVEAVAAAGWIPLSGDRWNWTGFLPEGYETGPNETPTAYYNSVTPGYFHFMGMPLVSGREFTDLDDSESPRVMIVNESFADRYWPGESALGRVVMLAEDQPPIEVVGVVRDARYQTSDFVNQRTTPHFWFPRGQSPDRVVEFLFKTRGDPALLFNAVREEVRLLDNSMPVKGIDRIEAVADAWSSQRTAAAVLGAFGMIILFIAALGIYAVVSFSVLERTRELGIRMALGARPAGIVRMVVLESLGLSFVGIASGLGLAVLVARGIRSLLLGVGAVDPASFLGSVVFLALAAMTASLWPALRASRVDLVCSLRSE